MIPRDLAYLRAIVDPPRASPVKWSEAQWDGFQGFVELHGLAGLAWTRLSPVPPPSGVAESLRDGYLHAHMAAVAHREDLAAALSELSARGIDVVPLKGAWLAEHVYDEPAHRTMVDLDLLVRSGDAEKAREALCAVGYDQFESIGGADYDRHHHLRPFLKPGAIDVELHVGLVPADSPFTIDVDGLWERTRPAVVAEVPCRRMAPADRLLHAVTHMTFNHTLDVPLISVLDVSVLARTMNADDWEEAIVIANGEGRGRYAFVGLSVAAELFGGPEENVHQSFQHSAVDEQLIDRAVEFLLTRGATAPDGFQSVGAQQPGWMTFRSFWSAVFPPRDVLRRQYRVNSGVGIALMYLWRPFDLAWRRGGLAAAWLLKTRSTLAARRSAELRGVLRSWAQGG